MIARALAKAGAPVKELNDAVLNLVEKEGAMKAQTVLYGLLTIAAVSELSVVAKEAGMHADLLGRLESPAHNADSLTMAAEPEVSFASLPFEEAKAFFERKEVMAPGELAKLEDRYKAKGFSIAGVHSRYVLDTAHQAIGDALRDGIAESEVNGRIRDAFSAAGVEHPGDFHIATAFDTNVLGSYAAGRYEQLTNPDVMRQRPYWQYKTAGDGRVRPAHRAMDGKVYPADDEVWQVWYPPNGYRCRCGVVSLSQADIESQGLSVGRRVPDRMELDGQTVQMLPDPGFAGSPATQLSADRVVASIDAEVARSGALGRSGEDLERARDAERARKIDKLSGLSGAELEHALARAPVFNVELDEETPHDGELLVDWAMYSQDLATAEQLTTRLVQTPGLYRLKDQVRARVRATYYSSWPSSEWPNPEVVYDDELAKKTGLEGTATVARSTEALLRLRMHPGELDGLLGFLHDNGERGAGRTPVRDAWEVQDVRVQAGRGVHPPKGDEWKQAVKNRRRLPGGRLQVTLSRAPLEGWEHEAVTVNASLWKFLA